MEHYQQPFQALHVAYGEAQSGYGEAHLTLSLAPSLYSKFYSKMAAVEPSTADTVCPNLYNLYSVVELYSYTAVIQYTSSTAPLRLWAPMLKGPL